MSPINHSRKLQREVLGNPTASPTWPHTHAMFTAIIISMIIAIIEHTFRLSGPIFHHPKNGISCEQLSSPSEALGASFLPRTAINKIDPNAEGVTMMKTDDRTLGAPLCKGRYNPCFYKTSWPRLLGSAADKINSFTGVARYAPHNYFMHPAYR